MKVTEVYTVEYSVVQNCYHIDTLAGSIQKNIGLCLSGQYNGYVVIGVCDDEMEALTIIESFKKAKAGQPVPPPMP